MEEYESTFDNISAEEFLDTIELMIIQNPEMDGVEIQDSKGRDWFIYRTNEPESKVVN